MGAARNRKAKVDTAKGKRARAKSLGPGDVAPGRRSKTLAAGKDEDRGRQVIRQWSILRALEATRLGLTVAKLHEQVGEGATLRTVYRDIDQLAAAGFPLVEKDGRWSLPLGTAAVPLKVADVLALLLAEELFQPASAGPLGGALAELRSRLSAQLSPQARAFLAELKRSHVATHLGPALAVDRAVWSAIDDACGREHCLTIRYATPKKEPTERVVEPHLVWLRAGRPYLVAYCRRAEAIRTFAIQRITHATVLDEAFERRAEFEPFAFMERGFGMLHGDVHEMVIEFSPAVAHLARERRWHATQALTENADGSVTLRMTAAGVPEVAAWIASFGGKVRALAPKALVEAVIALHRAGLAAGLEAATKGLHEGGANVRTARPGEASPAESADGGDGSARKRSGKAATRRGVDLGRQRAGV